MNVDTSNNTVDLSHPILIEISGTTIHPPILDIPSQETTNSIPESNQLASIDNLERLLNLPPINNDINNIWNTNPINTNRTRIFDISRQPLFDNDIFQRLRNRRSSASSNNVFPSRTNLRRRRVHLRRSRLLFNAINDILQTENDVGGINNLTNRVLQQSLYQVPDSFKNVLNPEGKKSISIKKYTNEYDDKKCPITCLDFNIGDDIAELPCKHIFTPESIFEWLETEKAECPICRYKLKSKEIKRENEILQISNTRITPPDNTINNLYPSVNNETTDLELQRAILRSIQENNESQENDESQDTMSYNNLFLLPPIPQSSDNNYDGWDDFDELENNESNENDDSYFDEIFQDIESDSDSDSDVQNETQYLQETQQEVYSENNDTNQQENMFYEDTDIDDFINFLFENPVDEEVV